MFFSNPYQQCDDMVNEAIDRRTPREACSLRTPLLQRMD